MHWFIDPQKSPALYHTLQGLGIGLILSTLFYLSICLAIDSFFDIFNIGVIYDLFRFICLIIILWTISLFLTLM